MYKNIKQGWYKLVNPAKFVPPTDRHMKSFNESTGEVEYKSGMELKAFRLVDLNPNVRKFSIEPFAIPYVKPTDGRKHRYYIDLFIEFVDDRKYIVEVKPMSQVNPPKKPDRATKKSIASYNKQIEIYAINQAKWAAAREFAKINKMTFVFLTERDLNKFA